jgi:hypothetical protein
MDSSDNPILPPPLRYALLLEMVRAHDRTFREGKLTGSFGLRWHYERGVLRKVRMQHPEHEMPVPGDDT